MKTSIKTIATAIVLTGMLVGQASANVSRGELQDNLRGHLSANSNVHALISGSTVTFTGNFDNYLDRANALRIAKATDGVSRVFDHTRVSTN